jgi:hypothetical protein
MSQRKRVSRSKADTQAQEEMFRYMELFVLDHPAQSPGTTEPKEKSRRCIQNFSRVL